MFTKYVAMIIGALNKCGRVNKNTVELFGVVNQFNNFDPDTEYKEAKEWYKINRINGEKIFRAKMKQELYHYRYLMNGLKQMIEYNRFYFKEEPVGSRKINISSIDCISSIQLIPRKEEMAVMVFIRSSDVENLLLVDLVGCALIMKELRKFIYDTVLSSDAIKLSMCIMIGSAHIYPFKDPRR